MEGMYHPLHLLLLYSGMVFIFISVVVEQYWTVTLVTGFALSFVGLVYYWWTCSLCDTLERSGTRVEGAPDQSRGAVDGGCHREVGTLDRAEHVDDRSYLVEGVVEQRRAGVGELVVRAADHEYPLGRADHVASTFHPRSAPR